MKMSVLAAFATACTAMALPGSLQATTFTKEKFECPIGGESFTENVVMSSSTFGQRPDGRPFGSLPVYPIVECPGNGFLLFDDELTAQELAALEKAVATPEYQAMRQSETPHYRAWWLKKQAGRGELEQINSLLQASWETDDQPQRKARYQAAFVNQVMALARTEENASTWFWYNLRAVNAMRELGYFDEGRARLELVMSPRNLPPDAGEAESGQYLAKQLRLLMDEGNFHPEPVNLVPNRVAIFRCVEPQIPLTRTEKIVCDSGEIQSTILDFTYKPKGGKKKEGEAAVRAAAAELRGSTKS